MYYRASYYLKRPWKLFSEFYYEVKYFIQRHTRGWSYRDTWSIAYSTANYVLPLLKFHRKNMHGYPGVETDPNCDTVEHWEQTLDKMIWSMEQIVNETEDGMLQYCKVQPVWDDWDTIRKNNGLLTYKVKGEYDWDAIHKHQERVQEGLDLFGKYFQYLWD